MLNPFIGNDEIENCPPVDDIWKEAPSDKSRSFFSPNRSIDLRFEAYCKQNQMAGTPDLTPLKKASRRAMTEWEQQDILRCDMYFSDPEALRHLATPLHLCTGPTYDPLITLSPESGLSSPRLTKTLSSPSLSTPLKTPTKPWSPISKPLVTIYSPAHTGKAPSWACEDDSFAAGLMSPSPIAIKCTAYPAASPFSPIAASSTAKRELLLSPTTSLFTPRDKKKKSRRRSASRILFPFFF